MTEHASSSRLKKRHSTLCSFISNILFKIVLLSFLAWFLVLIWFGIVAFYKNITVSEQAVSHLLNSDNEWLASKHLPINRVVLLATKKIETQIQDSLYHPIELISSVLQKMNFLINKQKIMTVVMILTKATEVIVIRLVIFILSLPLWMILLFVMVVDGLVQRDIRKFQAARESTFLFHRLKLLTAQLFYSFFLMYMSRPFTLQPETILLPMMMIVSVLLMLSIKQYKKYV